MRELAVALHDIAWHMPRKFDAWAEVGLDELPASELEILRLLVRAPGLGVGEVATELGLQPSNASATVRALVARGLLERNQDERDGRISRLAPTTRAQAIVRQREEAWGVLLRARMRRLQPEDAASLLTAVEAITALAGQLSAAD
jgi:DNA-binding MarR family transcriptional regulator